MLKRAQSAADALFPQDGFAHNENGSIRKNDNGSNKTLEQQHKEDLEFNAEVKTEAEYYHPDDPAGQAQYIKEVLSQN